jgi:hypothetical protein
MGLLLRLTLVSPSPGPPNWPLVWSSLLKRNISRNHPSAQHVEKSEYSTLIAMPRLLFALLFLGPTAVLVSPLITAAHEQAQMTVVQDQPGGYEVRADSHAPIGVMGDHMHEAGEWMVSYRYRHMVMEGNEGGTDDLSPEQIVTTIPNRFFGQPMQPPTLRVVPTDMTMEMHMLGAMYAPTDWVTAMLMVNYVDKEMDHITFQGPVGTARLGKFTTRSSGFGDTRLTGLFRLYEDTAHHLHLSAGISFPTGATTETDQVLAPNGQRPTQRLPYPMQLGSGTYDLLPGLTYTGNLGDIAWGAQYTGVVHLGTNDEGYSLGDDHRLTAWASYLWRPWASASFRVEGQHIGNIDGQDPEIVAPVQTADPDRQGRDRVDILFGFNLAGETGLLRGHRVAFEFGLPVYQDLEGPQLETDWLLTAGYQYSF